MEIQQLRHFVAVARYGHLGRAAEDQKLTQSGITRSIQSLEEFLGVNLLRRTARGVTLTPVGKELLRHAEAIVNQRERALGAIETFMRGDMGAVTIGTTNSTDYDFMPDVAAQVLSKHPGLRIATKSGPYLDLVEALRMGEIEFIVGLIDPSFRHPEVVIEELFDTRSAVVCRPTHPLAAKEQVTPEDLSASKWAMLSSRGLQHAFHAFFQSQRLAMPEQVIKSNSLIFIRTVLYQLDILSALPWKYLQPDIAAGKLVTLNVPTPGDFAKAGITRLADVEPSFAASVLLEEVRRLGAERGAAPTDAPPTTAHAKAGKRG